MATTGTGIELYLIEANDLQHRGLLYLIFIDVGIAKSKTTQPGVALHRNQTSQLKLSKANFKIPHLQRIPLTFKTYKLRMSNGSHLKK